MRVNNERGARIEVARVHKLYTKACNLLKDGLWGLWDWQPLYFGIL